MSTPSGSAKALTTALDHLVRAVAEAPLAARGCLATCQMCRNSVLYLLDTEPYAGDMSVSFERRIAGLWPRHGMSHANPDALDPGDSRTPVIRGLA